MLTPETIADLFMRYKPLFHNIAWRVLANPTDAQDAVALALLRALEHCGNFRGQSSPLTWLSTVVVNAARTIRRDKWRQRVRPLEAAGRHTEPAGFDVDAESRESLDLLMRAVSPTNLQALKLALADNPLTEIAAKLNIRSGAVRLHVHRARIQMREESRRIDTAQKFKALTAAAGRA